ncbi:hypothetical protein ASPBRDRAFT_200747 [Aspergillus brasiliensis CBS 101740]|uniref:Uncharacterized protein n=1 Tax=Aspergillus brasiliensis (strain CBS 101740 / IMI 381727 / IBT 21946) TaxID=767769 RepID=A0A1L9U505_ASPBC|nr:hypothetical protein ASPBRDRAFT_200747 [Aspergillus brasiliensis CBS 101740]
MSAFAWESWASLTEGRVWGMGAQANLIPGLLADRILSGKKEAQKKFELSGLR